MRTEVERGAVSGGSGISEKPAVSFESGADDQRRGMKTTLEELVLWGPEGTQPHAVPLEEAERYCRRLATTHYENFPIVSRLLPHELRQHFYNVYAYCRWADDLADEIGSTERSLELLDWWGDQLRGCYADQASHPVFVALHKTIREFEIPEQPFLDLISAFAQDQRVREYETFVQLRDYCRRSADPVGRLILYLGRQAEPLNFEYSDSICTGLQLANFWQDVRRDSDIGRTYLPREDRLRFGYGDADLKGRVTNPAFLELMRFEVERARGFLQGGLPLVERLPSWLQLDIDLFARGGLRILERIERIDYRVWTVRPKLSKWDFALLFSKGLWRRWTSSRPVIKDHRR